MLSIDRPQKSEDDSIYVSNMCSFRLWIFACLGQHSERDVLLPSPFSTSGNISIMPSIPRPPHHVFITPLPDTPVWRYMDLPKFVSFLLTKSLHFARADTLGDPLEGSLTAGTVKILERDVEELKRLKATINNYSPDEWTAIYTGELHNLLRKAYISCWHMGNDESMAMWNIYGHGKQGIALRTKFKQLEEAIPHEYKTPHDSTRIVIGQITYTEHTCEPKDVGIKNVFELFVHKHKGYSHELELRAMFMVLKNIDVTKETRPSGYYIPIEISKLQAEVIVSPFADKWFIDVVEAVCKRFGTELRVVPSRIPSKPLFGAT